MTRVLLLERVEQAEELVGSGGLHLCDGVVDPATEITWQRGEKLLVVLVDERVLVEGVDRVCGTDARGFVGAELGPRLALVLAPVTPVGGVEERCDA